MLKRIILIMLMSLVPLTSSPGEDAQGERSKPKDTQSEVQPAAAPKAEKALQQTPRDGAGVVVFIDPNTKAVRQPTPAEIGAASLGRTLSASPSSSYPTIMGPGGAVGVRLDDSSLMYMIGTRTPDGSVKTDCVAGDAAAAGRVADAPGSLKRPATAAKPPVKQ